MASDYWDQFAKKPTSNWTNPLTIIYGSYHWLNDRPIHYCLTSLSIRNLWEDIRLMNEIPGVEKWGFEALFQRVVREDWVSQIKSQYLGNRERFKFFPPVTIALLPCRDDCPSREYEPAGSFEFEAEPKGGHVAKIPGLNMWFPTSAEPDFPEFGHPAILTWDKSKYTALAIDGQHRISALRRFVPRESQNTDKKDVPATLLVFDPDLPAGRDLIQVTREIFIDINKNAKTVDDSRLILLDDRNFYNSLTRRLILQAYLDGENPSPIEYQKVDDHLDLEIPVGIPQELVDTAAGRESADVTKLKSWQFTSAFILNRSIRYFIFEDKFVRFEELLETKDFKEESEDEVEQAVARRRQEYEDGTDDEDSVISDYDMLSFRPAITEKLVERAIRMHGALILGVFTAFSPYKTHIDGCSKVVASEDGEAIRSLLLSEGSLPTKPNLEYTTKVALELKEDDSKFRRVKKAIEKLSRPKGWEDSLVWYSVFQRGLIYQPGLLRRAMENARNTPFLSREEFASGYVSALNELYDEGFFDRTCEIEGTRIWNGIALKIGDASGSAMDGSDGAAKRTGCLIRLMVTAFMARDAGGPRHLKACLGKHGVSGAYSVVYKGFGRYAKSKDSLAGSPKDNDHYDSNAKVFLEAILKNVAEGDKI